MSNRRALITGITGQDGSYLAKFLLDKGYEVYGVVRRASNFNTARIDDLYSDDSFNGRFFLKYGDLTDGNNLRSLVLDIEPTEVYNLAAQSHVQVSFELPEYTANTNALGALRLLDASLALHLNDSPIRFYQAGTSELFGKVVESPQCETTPFYPRSPYAVSKLFAHWMTINYREAFSLFACNGILFNHESPRRGRTFVTRKITRGFASIVAGDQEYITLGNLDALRDWGHAKDYVEMQWLMLQQHEPKDYVISSGKNYSVRDFVTMCANYLGLCIEWEGSGVDEIAVVVNRGDHSNIMVGQVVVRVSPKYFRPAEVESLLGDATLAHKELSWTPRTSISDLVAEMIEHDLHDKSAY